MKFKNAGKVQYFSVPTRKFVIRAIVAFICHHHRQQKIGLILSVETGGLNESRAKRLYINGSQSHDTMMNNYILKFYRAVGLQAGWLVGKVAKNWLKLLSNHQWRSSISIFDQSVENFREYVSD